MNGERLLLIFVVVPFVPVRLQFLCVTLRLILSSLILRIVRYSPIQTFSLNLLFLIYLMCVTRQSFLSLLSLSYGQSPVVSPFCLTKKSPTYNCPRVRFAPLVVSAPLVVVCST